MYKHKYLIEVDVTATAYIEVEADTEEQALQEAYEEAGNKTVNELKEWDTSAKVTDTKNHCYNCGWTDEEVSDISGLPLCEECSEELKTDKDLFNNLLKIYNRHKG